MSVTFDTTTRAAYEAATTATAKAAAVVSSLTGTIYVKVYNASNTAVGDGTMDSPWATSSGPTITIGEVTEFEVTTTGTPDSGWYIRFENSDASRWVRASFGLASSSQDFKWSLSNWEDGQTGTIGTATIVCPGNEAPVFTSAPAAVTVESTGGTIQFTATDPDGGAVVYSLTTTRSGITINSSTGLVTVASTAAGTVGNIVVRASDGILTASATCAVTVDAGDSAIYADNFDARTLGNITSSIYDGGTETWRLARNGDGTTTYLEIANSDPITGSSRYLHTRMVKSGTTNYRTELTLLPYGRDAMTSVGGGEYSASADYWYDFRFKINQNDIARAASDSIGGHYVQWHNDDSDPGLDSSKSPPMSLWWNRLGLRVYLEANDDTSPIVNGVQISRSAGGDYYSPYLITPLPVGEAHDYSWRIRWDTRTRAAGGVGAADLYIDDVLAWSWRGQNCHPYPYSNGNAPYFKLGLYMGYWRSGGWPSGYEGWVMDQSYDDFRVRR